MNRLDRFRFGNLHKRRIFILLVLIVLILVTSIVFLMFLGFFGSRAELPRVSASADLTSDRTEGVGINLLDVPDANIIDDPFFGRQDNYISAPVTDVSGNYIYFDPSYAGTLSGQTLGDTVNILSMDAAGNMGLRYSGLAVGFAETMFGVPVLIEDANAFWLHDTAVKTVESSGSLYVLTQSGKIISNAALYPTDQSVGMPFVDMCVDGITVYAVTANGDVYASSDSGPFALLGSCSLRDGTEAEYISVVNGNINVFVNNGYVMGITPTESIVVAQIDYSFVANGSGFMVVCTDDEVYLSRNGLFIDKLDELSEFMRDGDTIIDLESGEDTAFILTSYGRLIKIGMSDLEPELCSCDISSIEPLSICPSGNHGVIAVTSDNQSYYVSVLGGTPNALGLPGIAINDVMMFGSDRYIIRSGNTLYESSLKAALEVDIPIADDLVMEGDICVIKNSTIDTGAWDLYGETNLAAQADGVSLIGTGEGLHAMSRLLEQPANELFEGNLFYRIELTMSCDTADLPCDVWLEGDTFGTQGQHMVLTGSQTLPYTYVFAVTDTMLSDESLRFNISFEGDAVINIYNVYVGLDRYDINSVPAEFTEQIVSSMPAALRFDSIVPGSSGYCAETFYGVSAFSLERAMNLCKDSGSNPWIVMGSSIYQSDVDAFLGYICGSVTNPYGKLRIDNGTALPWSRQFDTIYIEINDSEGIFPTDSQRGAYVSYVISLFAKSDFYLQIKDRIVFVDGMNYEGGVMLSNADRHTSNMFVDVWENEEGIRLSFDEAATRVVEDSTYNTPRLATSGSSGSEFVSSFRINSEYSAGDYSAADVVSILIQSEMMFSDLIMIDSDMDVVNIVPSLRVLMSGELMYCETLDPLDSSSDTTAEYFDSACSTLLIDRNTTVCLIVANHSDLLQQFTFISDAYDTSNGYVSRYSADGSLVIERDLNRFGERQLLQPGEYMVIVINK